jgi:hypothetical protein
MAAVVPALLQEALRYWRTLSAEEHVSIDEVFGSLPEEGS